MAQTKQQIAAQAAKTANMKTANAQNARLHPPPATTAPASAPAAPAATPKYDFAQLEQLWTSNGGDPKWASTMAAVAYYGESGGDPTIANASGATGLWQILSSAQQPAFNAAHPAATMKDPVANVKAAIALLGNGSGISNWGTGTGDPVGTMAEQQGTPLTSAQLATLQSGGPAQPGTSTGAGSGAGASGQPSLTSATAQPTAAQVAERMKAAYGYGSWMMNNPELEPILRKAVMTSEDQNTFLGNLTATNWYKTTSEAQRDWQITQSTDPAKAKAQLDQARAKVLAVENQSGVQLSTAQVEQIAHKIASNSGTLTMTLGSQAGYTQEQLEQDVVKAANLSGQTNQGTNTVTLGGISGQLLDKFKTTAEQYLMYNPTNPGQSLLSEQALINDVQTAMQKYTGSGSFGSSNLINGATADFTQQMVEKAKQFYPSMAGSIDAGSTPQAYVQPLQRFVAQTLGFGDNSSAINVLDPQWNWMIATPDPKTGVKTAQTQDQILAKITNPNFSFTNPSGQRMTFDNTDTAMQTANTMTNGLSRIFGTGGA